MKAKVTVLLGLLLLVAAVASACGGGNGPRRTSVPQVDAVVQAVLSGDQEALRGFVRYTAIPCTTGPLQFGGPPECRPGEPDGAIVDVILVASCEGHYIRQDGLEEALTYLLAAKPNLYGVYQGSRAEIAGDYTVLFSVEGPEPGEVFGKALVINDDGAIDFIDFGCGESPEQLAQRLEQQPSPTPVATPGGGGGS
jgi:hypothetical protein